MIKIRRFVRVVIAPALLTVGLSACQGVVPLFQSMLSTPGASSLEFATLPFSSTQITGVSIPTLGPPAPLDVEVAAGKLAITVDRVIRPADSTVGHTADFKVLGQGEEYLMVHVRVRCIAEDKCRLTEFDFGVSNSSGRSYPAEFASSFSGLADLFEGGDMQPNASLAGWLVFAVEQSDTGLILSYPALYGFGNTARFQLGP